LVITGEVLAGRQRKDVFTVTGAKREREREWKVGENGEENEIKGYRVKGIYSARGSSVSPRVRV